MTIARQNDTTRRLLAQIGDCMEQYQLDRGLDAEAVLIPLARVHEQNENLDAQLNVTPGIAAEGIAFVREAINACGEAAQFDEFNDPYSDHCFGTLDVRGKRLFWQIDLYDRELKHGSPAPTDPAQTYRVITIMFPIER